MNEFKEKRLLLLGGSKPYVKAAIVAKELGMHVIVVDQNATSEILRYADEYARFSLLDIEGISKWCEKKPVDGILNLCVDFAQRTQQVLCERFCLPCTYDKQQVNTLANKNLFKQNLLQSNLEIIKTYTEEDIRNDRALYPVIIKPAEGSGSRGTTTCFDKNEALLGISKAKRESRSGDIIIEEYVLDAQEVQITYFLQNGVVNVIRTADSYEGERKDGLERVVACAISPSKYTEEYFNTTHNNVLQMVNHLQLHDGPFFMQGFYHEGKFKFFDPGCRFPGVDFDSIYTSEYNIDIAKQMVYYAITGKMPDINIPQKMYYLQGKKAAVLFPVLRPGQIDNVIGIDIIERNMKVFSISKRHDVGDVISCTHDVNQRFGEFDIIADNMNDLKEQINDIQRTLKVLDTDGKEMIYSHFDVNRIC